MDEMLGLMKEYRLDYVNDHAPGGQCFKTIRRKYLREVDIGVNVSYCFVHRQTGEKVIREGEKTIAVGEFALNIYEKSSESVRHKLNTFFSF
jgi:hypothetical protein